ncbi:hypothetical protein M3J09_009619 [Ascochyta lentis]
MGRGSPRTTSLQHLSQDGRLRSTLPVYARQVANSESAAQTRQPSARNLTALPACADHYSDAPRSR